VLQSRVAKATDGSGKIICMNNDFIETEIPGIEDRKKEEAIKFIVCDPTCSGSGMKLHTDQADDKCTLNQRTPPDQMTRVQALSKF